jgi:hypothetical protein
MVLPKSNWIYKQHKNKVIIVVLSEWSNHISIESLSKLDYLMELFGSDFAVDDESEESFKIQFKFKFRS